MTRLIFVRHGETLYNVRPTLSSAAPGPAINANGTEQARQLAAALAHTRIDVVCCSVLRRARQTAEILAAPRGLTPVVVPELRECGVGALEGRSDAAAFAVYHATWDAWLVGRSLAEPLGPGGETGHAALARMQAVVNRVCAAYPGQTVVLVSHAGFLHFTLSALLTNVPPGWTLPIPNAGTVVAVCDPGGIRCEAWCGTVPPGAALSAP
jgi:broad specificity phosphatase PhoE